MKRTFQNLGGYFLLGNIRIKLASLAVLLWMGTSGWFAAQAQYVSGDTSVCPGQVVTYQYSNGPWSITVLGGGALTPVPMGPVNSFTITWGSVPGTYMIRLFDGVTTLFQTVFVEGDIALACDDLVNVSLDGNCQALITPGVMLEGDIYPDESYQVTVFNTNGIPIPNNTVDYSHLGKTLKVNVRQLCTGVSCWGRIFIEDKFIPNLLCSGIPSVVSCDQDYSPEVLGYPLPLMTLVVPHATLENCYVVSFFDLCCDVTLCYTDTYTKYGCNALYYAETIRNWVATDCKGNTTSCKDTIYVTQGTLDSLVCPPNYDGIENPALQCDSIEPTNGPYPAGWNALDNGNPSPYDYVKDGNVIWKGTGSPANIRCDHMAITFRDIKIPVCGNSFKLLRTWRIFDWCTGRLEECVQFIKVVDERAPVVTCSDKVLTFPTDYYLCSGTAVLTPPDSISDCSVTTFTVEYKLTGPDGLPEDGDYRTENISYSNGNAIITGLPTDTTWVKYIITDACGNSSTCHVKVLVTDNLDPVAVCDEHTVVSINELGIGELYATSVDNGSLDNCELGKMEVRRMQDWCGIAGNTVFGPSVTFCCEDLGHNPHMVVFRVYDKSGNFNDCMVSVTVQEKIAPRITCPADITVDCGISLDDLNTLGRPVASNICANTSLSYKDDTLSWKCGVGEVNRRWFATTPGGRFAVCDQSITLVNDHPITTDSIHWPPDITVNGCKASDGHPDFAGKPSWPVGACSNLIAGYTDERFYNVGGYCIKIIRHWRVINWCAYDVNDPNSGGVFTREQIVYVRNTNAPVIDNATCAYKEACAQDLSCNGNIELIGTATDDCTDNAKLIWSYRIDLDSDGSFGPVNPGNNASGSYPGGAHIVEWTVKDSCGNQAKCNQAFRIKDCKQPTPFCKNGLITVLMPSTKSIAVNARFLDEKSEDNCTPRPRLRFSYSSNVNDSIRLFTCADIDNGIQDTILIDLYVTDLDGNQTFCKTSLILQDNQNVCPNRYTNGGVISGLVNTTNSSVLQNAHMELFKKDLMFGTINSERTGEYTFYDLPEGEDYKVSPNKNDDVNNGVSTADIVLIQKHILGIQKFNSVYQYIAADVNQTKSVTAADISDIRKLILGVSDSFRNGVQSWTFIRNSVVFSDPENPWADYPWANQYELKDLQGAQDAMDFMGVKMGDINYSAKTTEFNNGVETRSGNALVMEIDEMPLNAKGTVKIPVFGSWTGGLTGFQFSLKWNADHLQYAAVLPGFLDMNAENITVGQGEWGWMNLSWNAAHAVPSKNTALFYLVFNVVESKLAAPSLELFHGHLSAEAYDDQVRVMDLVWRSRGKEAAHAAFDLYQNQPNPFDGRTYINFSLSQDQIVKFKVYDVHGALLVSRDVDAHKGLNQLIVDKSDLGQPGVYYYQLHTAGGVKTRSLILGK
ncbi:MAG TPA: T9SS type A sorting domain-containing protein [Saprospiraceae bacterium]|nr:T9SS type A sorting domain-containing protein [Saprospiraceae bacterium]